MVGYVCGPGCHIPVKRREALGWGMGEELGCEGYDQVLWCGGVCLWAWVLVGCCRVK